MWATTLGAIIFTTIDAVYAERKYVNHENLTQVEKAFIRSGLDAKLWKLPQNELVIHFTKSNTFVGLGGELKPMDTLYDPTVIYEADPDSFHSLIAVDIDCPSHQEPSFGQLIMWQVVNIPGSKVHQGDTLVEYTASFPPMFSGLHRIVFLLFKQASKLVFNEMYVPSMETPIHWRIGFSTTKFALKYHLGRPIAGNFLQLQYDDSYRNEVPTYYPQN